MEKDKYISLSDSYIQIEGDEKEIIEFRDDIVKVQKLMVLSTKSSPKAPVKLTKKNLKNIQNKR